MSKKEDQITRDSLTKDTEEIIQKMAESGGDSLDLRLEPNSPLKPDYRKANMIILGESGRGCAYCLMETRDPREAFRK